ncbi:hypothetical protein ACGFNY_05000 [Streptomyces chartreusis]|uniref:hypothetical protein n=1 Tax=Streptomyces chartreusis TaxID=1969 RepID=UPI0037221B4D
MKTRHIEVPRRRPVRRYKRCGCTRRRSTIVDTFHAPLTRWGFTVLALLALYASMGWPFVITAGLAALAWKHR